MFVKQLPVRSEHQIDEEMVARGWQLLIWEKGHEFGACSESTIRASQVDLCRAIRHFYLESGEKQELKKHL